MMHSNAWNKINSRESEVENQDTAAGSDMLGNSNLYQ